jgi:cysteinyl-tRNA synthetase
MEDDFNTPEALAALFELVREINRSRSADPARAAALGALLRRLGDVLGILQDDPEAYLRGAEPGGEGLTDADIDALIACRVQAKKDKNWADADAIRDQLKEAGVVLEDSPGGTSWRRA